MESRRKSNTDYSDYHKKKASSGIDKRSLRAHRRSLEWKSFRADGFNNRRDLADLSPLKEVDPVNNIENVEVAGNKKPVSKAEQSRKDKLQKWKEEKELKRQMDAKKNKKVFKVAKVEHNLNPFKTRKPNKKAPAVSSGVGKAAKSNKPAATAAKDVKKPVGKPQPSAATTKTKPKPSKAVPAPIGKKQDSATTLRKPTLRSQPPRTTAKNQDHGSKPRPPVRTTRNEPAPSAATTRTTRSTAGKKVLGSEKPGPSKVNKKEVPKPPNRQVAKTKKSNKLELLNTEKVTCMRDTSLAPATFQFTAPENIQSFVFKPMSPASAAAFLLTSPNTSRSRCSTPIQNTNTKRKIPTPSEAIEGYDVDGDIPSDVQTCQPVQEAPASAVKSPAKKEVADAVLDQKLDTVTENSAVKEAPEEVPCKENICPQPATPGNAEFRTPGAVPRSLSRKRGRSLGTALTSGSKWKTPKNNRTSLILRALSPEEGVEVLKHSPMIELDRRTPKHLSKISNLPNFDDVSDDVFNSSQSENNGAGNKSDSQLLLGHEPTVERRPVVLSDPLPNTTDTKEMSVVDIDVPKPSEVTVADKAEVPKPSDITKVSKKSDVEIDSAQVPMVTDDSVRDISKKLEVLSADGKPVHDVPYFRKLVTTETDRLNQLCSKWEDVSNSTPNINEEALGEIRTTIGKAQLLIAQRFKQFTGLIDNCEFNTGEKAIHCSDLEGFWEMIYYQVEDVHKKFEELEKLQANNWQFDKPEVKKKKVPTATLR